MIRLCENTCSLKSREKSKRSVTMSRRCAISGKRPLAGNNVSHAHNKSRRLQRPNIQVKRLFVPELKRFVRIKMSTHALRTVSKIGLMPYLRKEGLQLKDVTS